MIFENLLSVGILGPTSLYVFDGFVTLLEADSLPLLGFVQIGGRYHGQGHVDHVLLSTARWLVNECSHGLAADGILNQSRQIFFPCAQEETVKKPKTNTSLHMKMKLLLLLYKCAGCLMAT